MKNKTLLLRISVIVNILLLGSAVYLGMKARYCMKQFDIYRFARENFYEGRVSHFMSLNRSGVEIVFLGDSLTNQCLWSDLFNDFSITNRGIGGDTTRGILNRLHEVVRLRPKKIFLMAGGNDFILKWPVEKTFRNYREIIEKLRCELPGTEIYIQENLPTNRHELNAKYRKLVELLKPLADNRGVFYIELYDRFAGENGMIREELTYDGAHLNGAGYLVWKNAIEEYVK